MMLTRLGKVVPVLIFLVSTLSCALFTDPIKPTQVVDLPPMVGKSLQELTTLLGPAKESGICYAWNLPEGEIHACYESGDYAKKTMSSISYRFPPPSIFSPRHAVTSPEEMAALVNIDLQGKKPDNEFQGGYSYNLSLNGKADYVTFNGGPKTIGGVTVFLK